jgi:hypothetical protein
VGAGSDLSLSLLYWLRGVRGSSDGVYVHHVAQSWNTQNDKKPFLTRQMSKWFYDTSTGTATRAASLWFFVGVGLSL